MIDYTKDLLTISQGYNITPEEVILAFALAAGAPVSDSYRIIFRQPARSTQIENETLSNSLLTTKPGIKVLIARIKNHKNPTTNIKKVNEQIQEEKEEFLSEEEENEFKTREGLIKKIINSAANTAGKEQLNALTTLAKMQGLDKPDETTEEEKRIYFLPWVSNCRSCVLMKLYKDVMKEQKP